VAENLRDIRLTAEPFVPEALTGAFAAGNPEFGGICSFVGAVRSDEDVEALELTHYEPLTLPGMHEIADRAFARFDLQGLLMVHRIGLMRPGEPIVCVAAAARHRRAAFQAADFCMDHLKSAAWFWKREKRGGEWRWIEPRGEDHADLARW
jgi:molybdopterin synthase catalytic subunit